MRLFNFITSGITFSTGIYIYFIESKYDEAALFIMLATYILVLTDFEIKGGK